MRLGSARQPAATAAVPLSSLCRSSDHSTTRRTQPAKAATMGAGGAATVTPETPYQEIPTPDKLKPLFDPVKLGAFDLDTRVVYAPLTRCRAENTVPVDISVQYYAERAHKGQLMLTEATEVSADGHGYPNTPGIYTEEQMKAWKPIVEAVHEKGATFLCQLWHCGRAGHSVYTPDGKPPWAPSAVPIANGDVIIHPTTFESLDPETPRPIPLEDIPTFVEAFRKSAANSMACGFDGIEIHAGNGYLIDQFLKDRCNTRGDEYGGSIENRTRFLLDIIDAVTKEVGADKVGVRLTPYGSFLDAFDSNSKELMSHVVAECAKKGVAYVHMIESRVKGNDDREAGEGEVLDPFIEAAHKHGAKFITAGGYREEGAAEALTAGHGDLVCMGRWALANPDLLTRFKLRAPLNKYDRDTFYALGPKGYIDYPFLQNTEGGKEYFASAA